MTVPFFGWVQNFLVKIPALIAYKGGQIEKEFLEKLNPLSLDLEEYGCLKADSLWSSHYPSRKSCGQHKVDTKFIHCPKQETFLFFNWLKNKLKA